MRHCQGIRVLIYLDKILLMAESPQQRTLEVDNGFASTIPGVHPRMRKCCLVPCSITEFLEFIVNSLLLTLQLRSDKVSKVQKECRHMLNWTSVSAQQLAHLIGLLPHPYQHCYWLLFITECFRGTEQLLWSVRSDQDYDTLLPLTRIPEQIVSGGVRVPLSTTLVWSPFWRLPLL